MIPEKPGTPENVNETEIRKDSVKISWEAPESGAEVAQYAVFLNGKQVARVDAAITEYTFTGLNAGTEYTVAVQAIGYKRRSFRYS